MTGSGLGHEVRLWEEMRVDTETKEHNHCCVFEESFPGGGKRQINIKRLIFFKKKGSLV